MPDVVEQIDADHQHNVRGAYVMTIAGVAQCLGLSRYAINRLIADGKLRVMTLTPEFIGGQPRIRIPVSDWPLPRRGVAAHVCAQRAVMCVCRATTIG